MKKGQIEEKYRHGQAGVGWASSSDGDTSCSSETPSLCGIKEMDLDLLYAGSEEAGLAHLSRGLCKGAVLGCKHLAGGSCSGISSTYVYREQRKALPYPGV